MPLEIFDEELTQQYSNEGKKLTGNYLNLIDDLNSKIENRGTSFDVDNSSEQNNNANDLKKLDNAIKSLQNMTKLLKDYLALETLIIRTIRNEAKARSIFIDGMEISSINDLKKLMERMNKENNQPK